MLRGELIPKLPKRLFVVRANSKDNFIFNLKYLSVKIKILKQ